MSQWTHVCGAIRVDGLLVKHEFAAFKIQQAAKIALPKGSEGPMVVAFTYTGHQDGNSGSVNIGTLMISGDLRDFDDPQVVFDWVLKLQKTLSPYNMLFRSVCILIEVEYKQNYLITQRTDEESNSIIEMKQLTS